MRERERERERKRESEGESNGGKQASTAACFNSADGMKIWCWSLMDPGLSVAFTENLLLSSGRRGWDRERKKHTARRGGKDEEGQGFGLGFGLFSPHSSHYHPKAKPACQCLPIHASIRSFIHSFMRSFTRSLISYELTTHKTCDHVRSL